MAIDQEYAPKAAFIQTVQNINHQGTVGFWPKINSSRKIGKVSGHAERQAWVDWNAFALANLLCQL